MNENKALDEHSEDEQESAGSWRSLLWLGGLVRPYFGRLIFVGLATLGSTAVSLTLPLVTGKVIDAALLEKSLERLRWIVFLMIGLFAASAVLSFVETYILRATAARLLQRLRKRLHGHLLDHSPSFFDKERVGDLLSRLQQDIGSIGSAVTSDLVTGVQQLLLLIGAVAILLRMQPALTGVMLLAVPPVVLVAVFFGFRFQRLAKKRQKRSADANVAAEESFAGIRTVKAFVREDHERARYGERLDTLLTLIIRESVAWGAFGALVTFFAFTAGVLVLWYGGTLLVAGEMTPGNLTAFLFYTGQVAGGVGSVASLYGNLSSAAGATERVRRLLDTEPEIVDREGARDLVATPGQIEFDNISFTYPGKEDATPAIDGLNLSVERGSIAALVGPSGGGKSTLIALLLRFHDVGAGAIRVDGCDIRDARLASLREAIGIVPQDIFLFGGSIAENIAYGSPSATQDQLEAAARAAHAHEFIARLPEAYETIVGERGVRLSVGERQRIALARVFLKDPAVVVLDEATSSLDAESEHLVQQALEELFRGRTTLVVAHRLATVRRADSVSLIDRGRIVEHGTHGELVAAGGLYQRFASLQMLDSRDD